MKFPLRLLLAVLLIVPACNRNQPRTTQAAPEERGNVSDQAKTERDAYVKSIDARLAEFDQKLDGLDKRAGAMTGSEKNDFKNQIDRLRTERKDVDNKLGDLKKVDVESWTTMKSGVDSAMASLERSYMDVSQRYKNLPETSNTPGTPKTRTY